MHDVRGARHVASIVVVIVAVVASACAKPKARLLPDVPLEIPPPPPRVVEASDIQSPPPVGLASEPARPAPDRPRATGPSRAERREAPKPEPPAPARPEDERRSASSVQTTPVERENQVEQEVRAVVAKAARDLSRVDYRLLDRDARTQYDTAKRFIDQAEDAVLVEHGAGQVGTVELRAVHDGARQHGAIVIEREVYRLLTGDERVTDAAFNLAPGATPGETIEAIHALPGGRLLEIAGPGEIRRSSLALFDRSFAVTYEIGRAHV